LDAIHSRAGSQERLDGVEVAISNGVEKLPILFGDTAGGDKNERDYSTERNPLQLHRAPFLAENSSTRRMALYQLPFGEAICTFFK
jgi:hypothetical protein